MALTVAVLGGSNTVTTTGGTKTSSSLIPTVGDLIVIISAHSGNTSSATPTDDNSSGTYTKITSAVAQSGVDTLSVFVRDSLIASAVGTIFTHAPGTSTGGGILILRVAGITKTGAAAVVQSAIQSNQASGGTPTPVLGAAVKTGNAVVGAVMNATNPATLTPRSSPAYSERLDAGYNTPTTGIEVMTLNSGETGTSIAWGGTSPSAFASLAIELDASFTKTYAPTGGLIFAGSASLLKSKTFLPTGGATFAGSGVSTKSKTYTPTGGLSFGGVASLLKIKSLTPTGGLTLGGIATVSKTKIFSVSGGITFGGSGINTKTKTYTPTGGLVFAGTGSLLKFKVYTPLGGFVFAGSSLTSITIAPITYTYLPHGGISFSGVALSSKLKIYTSRGGFQLSGNGSGVKTFIYPYNIKTAFDLGSDLSERINWRR